MRKRTIIIVVVVAGLAVATGAWVLRPQASAVTGNVAKALPTADERIALQAEADAACACSRNRGDAPQSGSCWADFERRLARFEYSTQSMACMEESTTSVCFGSFEEPGYFESCVLLQRPYGACSAEEARLGEARARASTDSGCG